MHRSAWWSQGPGLLSLSLGTSRSTTPSLVRAAAAREAPSRHSWAGVHGGDGGSQQQKIYENNLQEVIIPSHQSWQR
ncbi:hypothetical protein E2C01_027874 [Portunus trituberculatus]|uniref:Uncharacterized protein n=1 Tax=Portunus trituberculatus TaxID=210409 RepID=A0A5B7EJT9_PORTR|nr:hypothetical protein [Portunus trituberculatus]